MRRSRPLIDSFPEPERTFHQHRQETRRMGDQNAQMAELQRQLALLQKANQDVQDELTAAREVAAAEKTRDDVLEAEKEATPKSVADYMKPAVKIAVSPLVLPVAPV